MMVDWLSCSIPDPFGVPIDDGELVRVRSTGEIEWSTKKKKKLQGSHSSSLMVRNLMASHTVGAGLGLALQKESGLEVQGNPAKFLQGHNLFGSDDPKEIVTKLVGKIGTKLDAEAKPIDLGQTTISRIDLTSHWELDRAEDVFAFLKAMEETVWCPYRGRGVASREVGTLYYGYAKKGQRAKDWQIKIYAKGLEIAKRPLPDAAMNIPGLLDDVARTIRVELTLRTAELKRLGLHKLENWSANTAADTWARYINKLDFAGENMSLDMEDLEAMGIKPRLKDAICAWRGGANLKAGRSKTAYYKLVSDIRDATGIDVRGSVPKSNVVPLVRVISAKPAKRPSWASLLDKAMRDAA